MNLALRRASVTHSLFSHSIWLDVMT
jgi:hypothetical protein